MNRRTFVKLVGGVVSSFLPGDNIAVGRGLMEGRNKLVYQWQTVEFRFRAANRYEKPWSQVSLSVDFIGPEGQTFRMDGFWDGGRTWAVRFAPPVAGQWHYRTNADVADPGLKGLTGSFQAAVAVGENPLYRHGGILQVSADHRYLTYSDGTPFFWLGDTWWFCPSNLVPFDHSDHPGIPSMYKALVNKRKSQGFTIAQMAFIGSLGMHQDVEAFMNLLRGGKFNMKYWKKVDAYIQYANNAGIIPAIILDWHYPALPTYTLEQWKFLWRYFIARYGAHAVTWLVCGEYNNPNSNVAQVMAIGEFIKQCDPYKRAMSVHPWWYAGDKHQAWSQPWYDFVMFQGAHLGHDKLPPTSIYTNAWRHEPVKPIIQGECNYEGIRPPGINGTTVTAGDVRRTAWQAIQAGCWGYTYGANGLWYPTQGPSDHTFWKDWGKSPPWWVAMEDPGAQQMAYLKNFYEAFSWWKTLPRPGALVTPTHLDNIHQPLVRSDGDALHVVWFPEGGNPKAAISLKLNNKLHRIYYNARWFNPSTGKSETHSQPLTGVNGICELPARPDGYDWILLLKRIT